uniref:Granulins domain-containing protein n=1 Tax=Amphiprion ocellaris TaxID=80972 RepID=A0AAQ5XYH3_AMPOC
AVPCNDSSSCASGTTCCKLPTGEWGCCPLVKVCTSTTSHSYCSLFFCHFVSHLCNILSCFCYFFVFF